MPIFRDVAKKRFKQSLKRRDRNRAVRSQVRTSIKIFESALGKKEHTGIQEKYADFVKLIDTATGKGVYHRNAAARKKSRLHAKLKEHTSKNSA